MWRWWDEFWNAASGIDVLAGIDNEENCKATYEHNIGAGKFIKADVFELKEKELEKKLNLKRNDDNLLLIGCSPCQFWSIINTDKTKSKQSKNLLVEFERFVKYFNPGYVVVENVPGVLRKQGESGLRQLLICLNLIIILFISKYIILPIMAFPKTERDLLL